MRKRKNRSNGFPWSGPAFNDRGNLSDPACKKSGEEEQDMTNIAQGLDFRVFKPIPSFFHQYQRTPFNTSQPVKMFQPCHDWGAKDLGFDGIRWGEPVFAVEGGTVASVNRNYNCFSQIDPKNPNKAKINTDRDCWGHMVVVIGKDGYFTEYAHVMPRPEIQVGTIVQVGTLIGNVDNSGPTNGPHVHFARWIPQPNWKNTPDPKFGFDITYRGPGSDWNKNGSCFWDMVGAPDITLLN